MPRDKFIRLIKVVAYSLIEYVNKTVWYMNHMIR